MIYFTALTDCVEKRYPKQYDMKKLLGSLNQKCRDAKPDIVIDYVYDIQTSIDIDRTCYFFSIYIYTCMYVHVSNCIMYCNHILLRLYKIFGNQLADLLRSCKIPYGILPDLITRS